MRAIVCRFSAGLDDLSRAEQKHPASVLAAMKMLGKFSCFEASENRTIARTVTDIFARHLAERVGGEYPWTIVRVTELGERVINWMPMPPPDDPMRGFVHLCGNTWVHESIARKTGLLSTAPETETP